MSDGPRMSRIPETKGRYMSWKKIDNLSITPEAQAETLSLLQSLAGDTIQRYPSGIPMLKSTVWNDEISQKTLSNFVCSFLPRGLRGFLVVTGDSAVHYVDSSGRVRLIRARATCKVKTIATCVWSDVEVRVVCLLTDLIAYDGQMGVSASLEERLSILFGQVVPFLKADESSSVQFLFRPVANLAHITSLKSEAKHFYATFDFIELIQNDNYATETYLIPINFCYVLRFFYKEGGPAELCAEKEPKMFECFGKFSVSRKDYAAIDDCSCVFKYHSSEDEWEMIEFGGPEDFCYTVHEALGLKLCQKSSFNLDLVLSRLAALK